MVGECFSFPLEVASIAPGKHRVAVREKKFLWKINTYFLLHLRSLSFILDYAIWIPLISQNFCCNAERVDCFVNKDIWDIHVAIWMELDSKWQSMVRT